MRIDPHVHFRDGNERYKETIEHGLAVAGSQGVDLVFDMPNTNPPILRKSDVEERLRYVPESESHRYFLYVGATENEDQIREAVRLVRENRHVIGIKLYAGHSTGDLAVIDEDAQENIYKTLADLDFRGVLAVHCEKEDFIEDRFDPAEPYSHALSRPKTAETASVKDQIGYARESGFKGTLHICHISCKESVELVTAAREHMAITCGATPHHLLWDDSMFRRPDGLLYKTNPPLRSREDCADLRNSVARGEIDWIESDHAPHAVGEKLHGPYPSGYPSLYLYKICVEELLPALGLKNDLIRNLTCDNIKRAFDL